jgi:hypothetical protein
VQADRQGAPEMNRNKSLYFHDVPGKILSGRCDGKFSSRLFVF